MFDINKAQLPIGLYRHFKGDYYYVSSLSKSAVDEETVMVNYFNVCHPEYGNFVRPLADFVSILDGDPNDENTTMIKDRPDNKTGQITRFERIKDLNFQLGSVSTEQIVDELRRRTDSPIHELDIEGLESKIFAKDFVVGEAYTKNEDFPQGVYTITVHNTKEEAEKFLEKTPHKKSTRVFKRVFIEVW